MKDLFTRFNFTIFSMLVSGSFLAGFSVKTFYVLVLGTGGATVRVTFIVYTFTAWIIEVTDPMAVIRVIEACYMYRFE